MWSNQKGESRGLLPGRSTLGPLALMAATPVVAVLLTHLFVAHRGSLSSFLTAAKHESLLDMWPSPFDPTAWKLIGGFLGTQLVLMRVVPGKTSYGPVTPGGNVPQYKSNGFQCFVLSIALFFAGAYRWELYSGGVVYDNLPQIISAMNVFSYAFCVMLYIKGAFLWPSSSDSGTSGNPIFDFYWGTELYPRVLGWDVKLFTNCRGGMMFWGIGIISYACKQVELYGSLSDSMAVSVGLQLVYIAKFFWWEAGYMRSIDIMHDRAGYYLCWGCLVWVPSVYTSPAMYLVQNPIELGTPTALAIFATGVLMGTQNAEALLWVNYAADRQRMQFRETQGKGTIWGKPAQFIVATYTTEKGDTKQSLLLTSGWWGLSRHFHYVPEILAALCWTAPVQLSSGVPYFYVVYLTILLTDRAFRDDARCAHKYQNDWAKYCARVPNLILPKLS
ncbi:7-dehydrocholesterol reductase, partial [Globisporangium splendens]